MLCTHLLLGFRDTIPKMRYPKHTLCLHKKKKHLPIIHPCSYSTFRDLFVWWHIFLVLVYRRHHVPQQLHQHLQHTQNAETVNAYNWTHYNSTTLNILACVTQGSRKCSVLPPFTACCDRHSFQRAAHALQLYPPVQVCNSVSTNLPIDSKWGRIFLPLWIISASSLAPITLQKDIFKRIRNCKGDIRSVSS